MVRGVIRQHLFMGTNLCAQLQCNAHRQDSFEEVAEAPEEGAAPHSGAKDARGAKGAKGGGSLKVPQPDSPLDRSSSIAAVRP